MSSIAQLAHSTDIEAIQEAALRLPMQQRAELAHKLGIDLTPGPPRAFTPELCRKECSAVFERVCESYPEQMTAGAPI